MRKHELTKSYKKTSLPLGLAIITLAIHILIPFVDYVNAYQSFLQQVTSSLIILFAGWTVMRLIGALIQKQIYNLSQDKGDNLHERTIITRIKYVRIIIDVALFIVIIALILRQFDSLKAISTGMLASAGIVGVIVAFSAQKGIANLLAGIQVAFTQPIRIDDVVVVEGEWGRIEEIKATYVVVRIWDQRRLVLPISYFIEQPFENWTKTTAEIIGSVFIYTDYTIPIDKVRTHIEKFVKKSSLWDGRVVNLLATDTTESTVKLRVIVSAKNSSEAWDLRCQVREELVTYVQENYPKALPKTRVSFDDKIKKTKK